MYSEWVSIANYIMFAWHGHDAIAEGVWFHKSVNDTSFCQEMTCLLNNYKHTAIKFPHI